MNFAMAEREFASTDHDPLALVDFPTQLKLDFLGLDVSPTHVDHLALPAAAHNNNHNNHNNHNNTYNNNNMGSYTSSSPYSTSSNTSNNNNMRSTAATQRVTSEADQRAKNRLIVKRCYYKKIVRSCSRPCRFLVCLCVLACVEGANNQPLVFFACLLACL